MRPGAAAGRTTGASGTGLGVVSSGHGSFYSQNMAAAVLGAAPLLIVFLIFQRRIVDGIAGVGLK